MKESPKGDTKRHRAKRTLVDSAQGYSQPRTVRHPTFDRAGYPTDETLEAMEKWPHDKLPALLDYVRETWSDYGCIRDHGDRVELVTGGWSGNESIITALRQNYPFWAIYWESSHCGGLMVFRRPHPRKETYRDLVDAPRHLEGGDSMSNYCYAQIQIGGTVAKKWLGDFVQAINQDALCDAAYKRVRLTSAQELRHCLVGEHLYFQDDRARLGMFQQLEEFLRIHRVPFDRYSDPCDIADAKRVVLRKGMKRPELHRCSREGDEYVLREELLPLLKLKDPASLQRRLRGIVGDEIPPLPPFDVSALS